MPDSATPPPMSAARRAELDRAAQAQGYRDYASYYAFQYQLQQKHKGTIEGGGRGGTPAPRPTPSPAPTNNHLNGGLAGMFDYIRRAMGGN